ncbi:MAG: acyl-CoA dehydrogenase [Thermoanaerobaculia bacterium]|nr:acyl-CoA dehydrogenase [Thermoanaerobaculia bacterium]
MARSLTDRLRDLAPGISETERQALAAGTVWVDGKIFGGRLDWRELLDLPYPELSDREREFLEGPVAEICSRVRERDLERTGGLPEEVWEFLKEHRFFGLVIPPEYGGLGFSPLGASTVYGTLASRSLALSAVVLIPNSVGPGELLLEHGTEEQKEELLPRLARGDEIPCFALTEPEAGSDAASMTSTGVVFQGADGEPWIRLGWEKRYITLAPVATLLGLAFRLEDPDELLGKGPSPGITVALVSTDLPGVEVGPRHDPLGIPFPNGPTRGAGVEIPASRILGGPGYAGRGWQILMEALAGGRALSLPAQAAGGMKYIARVTGAYASVREQFGTPIARFEGVEEKLARIGGLTYLAEAVRVFTCGGVGSGERPAVVSALVKYSLTELARETAADAMDVMAGAGISLGPKNLIARAWQSAPIGITVEGANILTRTLIAFGQGVIRSHPWVRREMDALEAGKPGALFRALVGHGLHFLCNLLRSLLYPWTAGPVFGLGTGPQELRPHARRLAWATARFALWADLALFTRGSKLKRKGRLSGHLADQLNWIYLGIATVRRFQAQQFATGDSAGEDDEPGDLPLARWALEESLARIQRAHEEALARFGKGLFGWLARKPLSLLSRLRPLGRGPSETTIREAAVAMRRRGPARNRLTRHTFLPEDPEEPLARLEEALRLSEETRNLRRRVGRARKAGGEDPEAELGREEQELLRRYEELRTEVVAVDEFEDRSEFVPEPHFESI